MRRQYMIFKLLLTLLIPVLFTACSSMQIQKTTPFKPSPQKQIAVVPFYNYTQTPLAGYSAASMANVILKSHGYRVTAQQLHPDAKAELEENSQSRASLVSSLKQKGFDYMLGGEVTEWRYKTGIDAEPVVGLTVRLMDLKSGKTLYSGTGSKTALGSASLSGTAQKILDEILP